MEKQQTFLRLKPACIEVLQVTASLPQRKNARTDLNKALGTLLSTLEAVKPAALDARLAEYAFVPISQVLRISRTVPVRALELCLGCISILLRAGWGGSLAPELSGQLLILFTFMAKPSSADNGIAGTSEELQTSALRCMGDLFVEISRTSKSKQHFTATANIPALGEAVLVVLDSLTSIDSNAIKQQAVCAVACVISAIDDKDALASFLPRIVSSLTKTLTPSSSNRASFRVLERGLESLGALFQRLLSDQETSDLPPTSPQSAPGQHHVARSSAWLQATATQIKIALSNVLKLRNHDKIEVRKALLRLCITIIQDCRESLVDCVSLVIETMVTLAGDGGPNDDVEKELRVLLSADDKLSSLLRESLHGWIISLPRLMQSKDDTSRRKIIHQISVALRLLSGSQVLMDDLLADNLRDGVAAVLNDSKDGRSIVEAATVPALDRDIVLSGVRIATFEPLRLRLKGQEDMIAEFALLLREVARSDTAVAVAQNLVDELEIGSSQSRLASFWISVNLVRDAMAFNPAIDEFIDLGTSNPQEELLDSLYAQSLNILGQQDVETVQHWHYHALALETVALQATRYKTDFRPELSEMLYPVLHHLGSSNPGLRDHAITCLNIIAQSCNYPNASELVIANVDYIVNAVGLKLSYGDVSPQAPQVLLMMMRLCGPSLLPYLDDLVGSIFGALERYHGYPRLVELLFAVLKGMAEEGVKAPQLAITASGGSKADTEENEIAKMLKIIEITKKMEGEALTQDNDVEEIPTGSFPREPWKDAEGDTNEEDEAHDEETPRAEDPPPPAPRTFDILLKISELTQHYLTSSSPSLRTSLLSLLHTTIPALAAHESSFLPLINTLWPVLLPRLEDPEAYIVSNALDIVALMCTHAGNFMRSRMEGAWDLIKLIHQRTVKRTDTPKIRSSKVKSTKLIDLSNITHAKTKPTISRDTAISLPRPEMYVDAPTRMIWDALVRLLCAISRHIDLREEYFDDILDIVDPVLGSGDVKKALDYRNADAVWLRLFKKDKRALEEDTESNLLELSGGSVKMPKSKPEWNFVGLYKET